MTKEEYEGERADALWEEQVIRKNFNERLRKLVYKKAPNFALIKSVKHVDVYNKVMWRGYSLTEEEFNFLKFITEEE